MPLAPDVHNKETEPPKRRRAVAFALERRDSRPSERAPEDGAPYIDKTLRAVSRSGADIDISDGHPKSFVRLLSSHFAEKSRGGEQQIVSRFAAIFIAHRRFFQQFLFFVQ
jgi:hypothetical protein